MRHEIRIVFSLSGSLSCVSATVGAILETAASLAKVNFNPFFPALHDQGSAGLPFVCPDFRAVAVRLSLTLSLSLWVGGGVWGVGWAFRVYDLRLHLGFRDYRVG